VGFIGRTNILLADHDLYNFLAITISTLPNNQMFDLHSICTMTTNVSIESNESSWNLIVVMAQKIIKDQSSYALHTTLFQNTMNSIHAIVIDAVCPDTVFIFAVNYLYILHCESSSLELISLHRFVVPQIPSTTIQRIELMNRKRLMNFNGNNLVARLNFRIQD
jgi:hypothetical protein